MSYSTFSYSDLRVAAVDASNLATTNPRIPNTTRRPPNLLSAHTIPPSSTSPHIPFLARSPPFQITSIPTSHVTAHSQPAQRTQAHQSMRNAPIHPPAVRPHSGTTYSSSLLPPPTPGRLPARKSRSFTSPSARVSQSANFVGSIRLASRLERTPR